MKMRGVLAAVLAAAVAPLATEAALLRAQRALVSDDPADEAESIPAEETSEDQGLRGLDEQVTKLVAKSQVDAESAAAEATGLSEVTKLINKTLAPAILKEHEIAEGELKTLRAEFDKCKPAIGEGSPAMSMFANSDKKDKEHQECRKNQGKLRKDSDDCQAALEALKRAKDAACGAFEAVKREPSKAAADCNAAPAQEYGDWLESNFNRFKDKLGEYKGLEKDCVDATNAYKAQVPVCEAKASEADNEKLECDAVQAAMEDFSCSAQTAAQAACKSSDRCYERAKKAYEDRKPVLQAEERARKVNWRVFKRMECLIEIIMKKGTAEDIEKCREKTHDTTHLDLEYFEVPDKLKCEIKEPVPCSDAFSTAKYGGLPSNAPAAECKTCPGMAGSALTVPRWEPTMATAHEVCIADTVYEFTAKWDCGGNDVVNYKVPTAGAEGWREQFDMCARECGRRDDCSAFNYPSPGNGNCYIKRSLRKSASRGWNCGRADGPWSFFTKVPGASCYPPTAPGRVKMLHHVSSCNQCGFNFCDSKKWYKNENGVERLYTTGSTLSEWGCSGKDFNNMQIVRDTASGAIYVVERDAEAPKDADTLHWVGSCKDKQCGYDWCQSSKWSKNDNNVEKGYIGGSFLSEWGCKGRDFDSMKVVRNSRSGAIYVVEPSEANAAKAKEAAASGCEATLYEHDNFEGWSVKFSAGDYDHGSMTAKGAKNDQVSSLKVVGGAGCQVELFEHGFTGWKATFGPGSYPLSEMKKHGATNDQVSSLKVKQPCVATLYEHDNFKGWSVKFAVGSYDNGPMTSKGAKNDQVSSIKVDGGSDCKVEVFEHGLPKDGDYKGWKATFGPGSYTLSKMQHNGAHNDAISSLKVTQ